MKRAQAGFESSSLTFQLALSKWQPLTYSKGGTMTTCVRASDACLGPKNNGDDERQRRNCACFRGWKGRWESSGFNARQRGDSLAQVKRKQAA